MQILTKINDKFYSHFDVRTAMLFTLKKGKRGIYSQGEAWYLSATYGGVNHTIATFSTKNDGHGSYKDDYMSKLWDDFSAIREANEMVRKMTDYDANMR